MTVRTLRDRFGRARLTPRRRAAIAEALERAGVALDPGLERAVLDDELVLKLQSGRRSAVRWSARLWQRGIRAWRALVAVLGLVSTLIGLYAFFEPRLWPADPEPLSGDLNVAVAPFTPAGGEEEQRQLEGLVRQVRATLGEQFKQAGRRAGVNFDIAPPPPVDRIDGESQEERAAAAEGVAARLNADVVVYASIRIGQDETVLAPRFFLSARKLENAEELIGDHGLGAPLEVEGSVADNPAARVEAREGLVRRARVLSDFIFGLGHFSRGEYEAAGRWFRKALGTSAAGDGEAQAVTYLFLGHAAGRRGALGRAKLLYESALDADPGYGRARYGLAEVRFQSAHRGCRRGRSDEGGLRAALRGYREAGKTRDEAYGSPLRARSQFGQARVLFCLSATGLADRWASADALFRRVVEAYEGGERRLRHEASEALGYMGLIRVPSGRGGSKRELRAAAGYYERAVRLSRDDARRAIFWEQLGRIYKKLGDTDTAHRAYGEAISVDPDAGNRRRYEKERQALRGR